MGSIYSPPYAAKIEPPDQAMYGGVFAGGDRQHLMLALSSDCAAWNYVGGSPIFETTGDCGDSSIAIQDGIKYVAFTYRSIQGVGDNQSFGIITSSSWKTWSGLIEIDMSSVANGTHNRVWAPDIKFYNGILYAYIAISTDDGATFSLYQAVANTVTATSIIFGDWTIVALSGVTGAIDPALYFRDGIYYLYWKNADAAYTGYATSSSPIGPWSVQVTGTADTLGLGGGEGPFVLDVATGPRVFIDKNVSGGSYNWSDSISFPSTWTAPIPLTIPYSRPIEPNATIGLMHGSAVRLTTLAEIVPILAAALSPDQGIFSYTGNKLYAAPSGTSLPFAEIISPLSIGPRLSEATLSVCQPSYGGVQQKTRVAFVGINLTETLSQEWTLEVQDPDSGSGLLFYYNGVLKFILASDATLFGTRLSGQSVYGDRLELDKTIITTGTTGAATINKCTGSVNFAAAAASLVVTNSLATTSSIITATVNTVDATMYSVVVTKANGSFTLTAKPAAPTGEVRVDFHLTN